MARRLWVSALLSVLLLGTATHATAADQVEVRSGDTLSGLARRHGSSARLIAAANGLRPDYVIRVGQKLLIPDDDEPMPQRSHVVASGETLAKIARRYDVPIKDLVAANRLRSEHHIRIGQELVVPGGPGGAPAARAAAAPPEPADPGLQVLQVPGAAPAFYFEPEGPGRLGLRPVFVYLHGRGAIVGPYCQRWAKVVRHFGWLVCPQGPEDRGEGGKRGWGSNWAAGRHTAMAALQALRDKYGRRVQLYGNTIMGFSEGAFMAMNVGLMEPRTFNRWLILAPDTDYWGPHQLETLDRHRDRIRRVYLITGQRDVVYEEMPKVRKWLRSAGVDVRISTPEDMGHTVALETKPAMYKAALSWLSNG
jgi:LysM repeat protein/predicted esterase